MRPPSTGHPSQDESSVALLVEGLRAGRTMDVRLWGRSMLPWLWPGTRVRVEPGAEVREGDIVVLERAGGVVAHRILACSSRGWIVRGDYYGDTIELGEAPLGRVTALHVGMWVPLPRAISVAQSRLTPWTARGAPLWQLARRVARLGGLAARRAERAEVVLFADAHRRLLRPYFYERNRRPTAAALASWDLLLGARSFAIVAIDRSRIVGHALLALEPDGRALTTDWWIAAPLRGLGLGRRVARRMLEESDRRGVERVVVHARPENPSHALARSLGFVRSPADDRHEGVDALVRHRPPG
ncbi:MAG: GNAT family N-acetyltransferase [Sandaracinaceae bacterium]|nr:GNAT family N-acetyltransferase [Sandaracinaceae bacterium]